MVSLLLEGVFVLAVSLAVETLPEALSNKIVYMNQNVCSANKQYIVVATSISSTEKGDLTYVRAPTSSILYRSQGSIWELYFSLVPVRSLASFWVLYLRAVFAGRNSFFHFCSTRRASMAASVGSTSISQRGNVRACIHAYTHIWYVPSCPAANTYWLPTDYRLAGRLAVEISQLF